MHKYFTLLLIAASLVVSFGLASKSTADTNQSAFIDPLVTPTPFAEIERIELDRNEVVIPCVCKGVIRHESEFLCMMDENDERLKEIGLITVKAFVRNPKNKPLSYEYEVSGGKITGQGDQVVWDLTGIRPGTYTITASIKGKRRISTETKTLSAVIRECDCTCPCVCPNLDVSGGGIIKAGETMSFEAHVSPGIQIDYTFNWTVSQGEIIEGQGTSKIKVKTTAGMTGNVTATVEIGGDGFCYACQRTASETGGVEK
jgi:hypothetical protein